MARVPSPGHGCGLEEESWALRGTERSGAWRGLALSHRQICRLSHCAGRQLSHGLGLRVTSLTVGYFL